MLDFTLSNRPVFEESPYFWRGNEPPVSTNLIKTYNNNTYQKPSFFQINHKLTSFFFWKKETRKKRVQLPIDSNDCQGRRNRCLNRMWRWKNEASNPRRIVAEGRSIADPTTGEGWSEGQQKNPRGKWRSPKASFFFKASDVFFKEQS